MVSIAERQEIVAIAIKSDIRLAMPSPPFLRLCRLRALARDYVSSMPLKVMPSSAARVLTIDVGRPNRCAIVIALEPPFPIALWMLSS